MYVFQGGGDGVCRFQRKLYRPIQLGCLKGFWTDTLIGLYPLMPFLTQANGISRKGIIVQIYEASLKESFLCSKILIRFLNNGVIFMSPALWQ